MAFKIVDRTYTEGTDRDPEAMGVIEGYTSNTVGETYLRINCREKTDQEHYDWFLRVYGEVPRDVMDYDKDVHKSFLRERRVGDYTCEGIRLDRGQVIKLIWELIKWLIRGW